MKRCAKTPDLRISRAKLLVWFSLCLIFTLQILSAISFSQTPNLEWVRTYGPSDSLADFLNDMDIDTNGNVYVTGRIAVNSQNTNYATVKYNSAGVQQWVATYNGIGTNSIDEAVALRVDKAGNVFVTGYSEARGFLSDTYVTIKYNTNGVMQWLAKYDGGVRDDPKAIFVDDSGYVYISGISYKSGQGSDYLTIKYDKNGDSVWVKRYNGPMSQNDNARDMTVDGMGNVYVTGDSQDDYLTIKYSPQGQLLWAQRYTIGLDISWKVVTDNNGNVFVTGTVSINNNDDILTIKYLPDGSLAWYNRYNGTANSLDNAKDMKLDPSQNIYVTGVSSTNSTGTDYITIKYNQNGDTNWVRYFTNGSTMDNDIAYSIDVDGIGVYVTGRAYDINSSFQITTVKYDLNGNLIWVTEFNNNNSTGNKIGKKVKVFNGIVVVAGDGPMTTNRNFITIKYNQLVGINNAHNSVPNVIKLSNYPNPFNPVSIINYYIPQNDIYTLNIYDVTGKEVEILFKEMKQRGGYSLNYNAMDLSAGIYFMKLSSSKYIITHKIVVLK